MLVAWLDAAQTYNNFWHMTPAEILRIVDAIRHRDLRDHEAQRVRNFELAGLISVAHHDPSKMLKYKPIDANKKNPDNEVNQARGRGALIAFARAGKNNG